LLALALSLSVSLSFWRLFLLFLRQCRFRYRLYGRRREGVSPIHSFGAGSCTKEEKGISYDGGGGIWYEQDVTDDEGEDEKEATAVAGDEEIEEVEDDDEDTDSSDESESSESD
jgi:hypothetical protein